MAAVFQLASWGATAYLAYSFYQTGTYVYSLWTPPSCDPNGVDATECFCSAYTEDTAIHFEIYVSPKKELKPNFQSSSSYQQVYSSALPPRDGDNTAVLPPHPMRLSFDQAPIHHVTSLNGRRKPFKLHRNKSHIYAHIVSYNQPNTHEQASSLPKEAIFKALAIPLTYYESPPADIFSLKTMKSGKERDDVSAPDARAKYSVVQYYQPNLTVFYVVDFNCYPKMHIPGDLYHQLVANRQRNQRRRVESLEI